MFNIKKLIEHTQAWMAGLESDGNQAICLSNSGGMVSVNDLNYLDEDSMDLRG